MKDKLCYPNCPFLNVTEQEQDEYYKDHNVKRSHICNKYKRQVKHLNNHPNLVRLKECNFLLRSK